MRDVFIFVNGILTAPGNSRAWTDRAVHWFNNRTALQAAGADVRCYAFEYYSPALLRRVFQARHAADLAETIAQYPSGRLHLVGHSNGCDLIARALALTSAPIASVHLISAALDHDFRRNGLGERLDRGQIGRVFCLCSRGDHVLKYLARGSRLATFGLLGYGSLGFSGAKSPVPAGVRHVWRDSLGHGDWFNADNFALTMEAILQQAIHAPDAEMSFA